ncbi:MAG: pilus assembly protein TadG-related protein [Rhizobiaceae bacterium]
MMTAILAVPLLLAVGTAVDVARLIEYRTSLQNAADAAVLAAISEGSPGRDYAYSLTSDGEIPPGERDAELFFQANFIEDGEVVFDRVDADVRRESRRIVSTLSYDVRVPIVFGGLLGISYISLKGHATAEIPTDAAIDFYLLLDNTPSMGVGATPGDISKMVSNTPDKCAFACHSLDDSDNYYNLAKSLGVAMRIDVVRQATQKLTETAESVRQFKKQYRMAVYSFGAAATSIGLTEVAKLSWNMKQVKKKTDGLDLMTIPHQNYDNDQQTSFDKTLSAINKIIPDPGSGLGSSAPQKILFFVSDGVGDSYKPYDCTKNTTGGRCQEPIDTSLCEAIKARGIKIAVLYTTYLPLPTNGWYNTWIKPFQDEIGPRMESCASQGLFFEVSPSEGIPEAMDALFLKALSVLRLSS